MKLEIKHLAPYLPYGLKFQYRGIVNLKEIREYNKTKPKTDFWNLGFDWEYKKPLPIIGDRIGIIKEIKFYKKYTTIHFGNYHGHLKTLFLNDIKPILHPLSDLVKEIEIDGEKFTPAGKMITHGFRHSFWYDIEKFDHRYLYAMDYEKLLEWNFDIFGLINEGLAIDINEQ